MKGQSGYQGISRPWETSSIQNFLNALPAKLKEEIIQARVYGVEEGVVDALFKLIKLFKLLNPGSLDEMDQLHKQLTSPNPCSKPQAVLSELMRLFRAMTRSVELRPALLGIEQFYRRARSIYVGVFQDAGKEDFNLLLR